MEDSQVFQGCQTKLEFLSERIVKRWDDYFWLLRANGVFLTIYAFCLNDVPENSKLLAFHFFSALVVLILSVRTSPEKLKHGLLYEFGLWGIFAEIIGAMTLPKTIADSAAIVEYFGIWHRLTKIRCTLTIAQTCVLFFGFVRGCLAFSLASDYRTLQEEIEIIPLFTDAGVQVEMTELESNNNQPEKPNKSEKEKEKSESKIPVQVNIKPNGSKSKEKAESKIPVQVKNQNSSEVEKSKTEKKSESPKPLSKSQKKKQRRKARLES